MKWRSPKWNSGPPPSIGWWPASLARNPEALRWWDGKRWSKVAWNGDGFLRVAAISLSPVSRKARVEWTDRPASWPKRSKT